MRFQFYSEDDFLFRSAHLNLHRIKHEPVKIGNLFYEYKTHTIQTNDKYECAVIILLPMRVEKNSYPKEYYEVDSIV